MFLVPVNKIKVNPFFFGVCFNVVNNDIFVCLVQKRNSFFCSPNAMYPDSYVGHNLDG